MLENRKSYRLPLRAKLIFSDGMSVNVGNILNISFGGVYVGTTITPTVSRGRDYRCVFALDKAEPPVCITGQVKRIVAVSVNPEIYPGIGFSFEGNPQSEIDKIDQYILEMRRNYELVTTILSSGDPDWSTLGPILSKLHLPPFQDLTELRFLVERIVKSMEMVDQNAARER